MGLTATVGITLCSLLYLFQDFFLQLYVTDADTELATFLKSDGFASEPSAFSSLSAALWKSAAAHSGAWAAPAAHHRVLPRLVRAADYLGLHGVRPGRYPAKPVYLLPHLLGVDLLGALRLLPAADPPKNQAAGSPAAVQRTRLNPSPKIDSAVPDRNRAAFPWRPAINFSPLQKIIDSPPGQV